MSLNTPDSIEQLQKDTTVQTVNFDTDVPKQDIFKDSATVSTSDPASTPNNIKSLFNVKTILIMTNVLLLILVVAVGYFLYLQHTELEKIKTSIKYNSDRSNNHGNAHVNSAINKVTSDVEQLKNILKNLEEKVEQLQTLEIQMQIEQQKKTEENSVANNEQILDETKNSNNIIGKTPEIQNIFFPSPYSDMSFSGKDASVTKNDSSMYVANYDTDNNSGKLTILDNANIERALNSPEMYLEPVCEYLNEFNSSKRISIIEPGVIIKDGEHWIVTKKIKIEFK
jgi:hypothetical protein